MSGRASLTASRVTRKGTAFREKKVISPGQYALLAAVLISVFKLSVLSSVVSEYAGRDAWMCAVIIIASELMVLVPISNISLSRINVDSRISFPYIWLISSVSPPPFWFGLISL